MFESCNRSSFLTLFLPTKHRKGIYNKKLIWIKYILFPSKKSFLLKFRNLEYKSTKSNKLSNELTKRFKKDKDKKRNVFSARKVRGMNQKRLTTPSINQRVQLNTFGIETKKISHRRKGQRVKFKSKFPLPRSDSRRYISTTNFHHQSGG